MSDNTAQRPEWDQAKANALIGKYALIGITYLTHEGTVRERKELHGVITAADPRSGITIDLKGLSAGTVFRLPPELRAWEPAAPGEYHLHSTGEVVGNPDVLCTWSVTAAPPGGEGNA